MNLTAKEKTRKIRIIVGTFNISWKKAKETLELCNYNTELALNYLNKDKSCN